MTQKKEKFEKQELHMLYIKNNLSMFDISKLKNCSESFIKTNLVYHDIAIKNCSAYVLLTLNKKELMKEYIITIQDMEDKYLEQDGFCAISGIKLRISACRKKAKESTASLDRIDSSQPYIKNNIQWVHKRVQQMKWNINQDEFIEWCKIIAKNN